MSQDAIDAGDVASMMTGKKKSLIREVQLVPAIEYWPDKQGQFVARGLALYGEQWLDVRTSILVHVDIAHGYLETLNTIYVIQESLPCVN